MNTKGCTINNLINGLVGFALILVGLSTAQADWSGGIEGGTVLNNDGGNASRLRLKLSNNEKPLSHYLYADWLREDIGNSFEVGYKPQYWFGETLYVFAEARARQDKPRSIDRELFGLTGVGVEFLNSDTQSLFAELGAGYRTTEFENDLEDSGASGIARVGFRQIFADLLSLELDADTDVSDTISASTAEAGIAVRVAGGALKYSYRTRRFEVDGLAAVTASDSFVSFNYGF